MSGRVACHHAGGRPEEEEGGEARPPTGRALTLIERINLSPEIRFSAITRVPYAGCCDAVVLKQQFSFSQPKRYLEPFLRRLQGGSLPRRSRAGSCWRGSAGTDRLHLDRVVVAGTDSAAVGDAAGDGRAGAAGDLRGGTAARARRRGRARRTPRPLAPLPVAATVGPAIDIPDEQEDDFSYQSRWNSPWTATSQ
jgi:hypothetical protein